jgi:NTE family protein
MGTASPSTTAFVLAGGGSLGAVQVGMLKALDRGGMVADFVVGASVGAINAAYYAASPDVDRFADRCELLVVPPLCPLGVNTYDFTRTAELIRRADAETHLWLEGGMRDRDPRWALAPHRHRA